MPTSTLDLIPHTIYAMRQLSPTSILDVGCGYGKWGVLFREYVAPCTHVIGVEAWPAYVVENRLHSLYDHLWVEDVRNLTDDQLNCCDAVHMGDVIEHLPAADGRVLIDRIRCPVVITTPEHFYENPGGLPPTEAHVSHWTPYDFEATGRLVTHTYAADSLVVTLGPA